VKEIFRNLLRRKVRSALTISGIVIGIFALTTMGAMAEHFNSLLGTGVQYAGTAIHVGPPAAQQGGLLPLTRVAQLQRVPGVAAVYPSYSIQARPGGDVIQMGPPEMITAEQRQAESYGAPHVAVAAGRDLADGARGEVVLGFAVAADFGRRPGQALDLPARPSDATADFVNHRFTVAGVLARTGNPTDDMAYVGDADARMLLADTLPATMRGAIDVSSVAQGFTVYPANGTSLTEMDRIAQRINDAVPGVQAQKPSVVVANFKSTGNTFTAVMTGAAILALIIGGLSVVNTMIMAVGERVREIGLKKALGAHTGQVMAEYLFEASVIGALGGAAGYLLGLGLTTLVNQLGGPQGLDIFLVTPKLTAIALGFAVGLATAAGVFPALRAARLDPVGALRSH
jgi:putative ABC transport system permease protein